MSDERKYQLYDRVRGDLDLTKLARAIEDIAEDDYQMPPRLVRELLEYATQVRDLRDRLMRGPPVAASDLDIEQYLAVDMLKQIRKMFKIPDTEAIIPFLDLMLNQWSDVPSVDNYDQPGGTGVPE